MQPKADMVPKECGFNHSETASCLCATFSMIACNGKGWWTYTNAVFLLSHRHNLLPANYTERRHVDVTIIRFFRTSYFQVSYHQRTCSLAAQKPWWCCESRKIATLMNSSFFVFKISLRFGLRNYGVKYDDYNCKVMQSYSMRLVIWCASLDIS